MRTANSPSSPGETCGARSGTRKRSPENKSRKCLRGFHGSTARSPAYPPTGQFHRRGELGMRGRHLRGALVASLIVLVTPVVAIGTASADPSDPPLSHCEASTGVVSGAMQLLANLRALDPLASFYSVDLVYRTLSPQAQAFTGPSCTTGQVSCDDQWPCTYSVKLTAKSLYGRAAARIDLYGLDQLGNWIRGPGSRNWSDGTQ